MSNNIYDVEGFEHLEELHIKGIRAADVIMDMKDKGPLGKYLLVTRAEASEAMEQFGYADLSNVALVSELQARIRLFMDACQWASRIVSEGEDAAQSIREEYGETEDDQEFDDA